MDVLAKGAGRADLLLDRKPAADSGGRLVNRTWLLLAFRLLAGALTSCGGTGQEALSEGDLAPSFRLPAAGGDFVSLTDYAGKDVLLYFNMAYG